MQNLLIHIGYHKTGTTWLQNELFTAENEFFIPVSNRGRDHSTLAPSFIESKDGQLLSPYCTNEKLIRERLNKILKKTDFDNEKIPVISSERLSGNPHSSGFDSKVIAERIQNFFPKAKILIVIREQSSWLLSNYFQYLTAGGTHHLKKYLNTKYDGLRPGFSPYHIQFHHLIKDYQSRFGKENVLVIPYEIFKNDPPLFLKTLGDFVGKDLYNSTQPNFKKIYNAKNDHYINYKFRELNAIINPSSVNNYSARNRTIVNMAIRIKKILSRCTPQKMNQSVKLKLKNEIDEWAKGRFKESNSVTQELIGFDLGELGYQTNT